MMKQALTFLATAAAIPMANAFTTTTTTRRASSSTILSAKAGDNIDIAKYEGLGTFIPHKKISCIHALIFSDHS